MECRSRIKSSEINISQKNIRPKVRAYLTANNATPDIIEAFKRGFCNGMATLAIYGLYLESLEKSKSAHVQSDNWTWLKKTLKKLSCWDENLNSLRKRDRANIERLISHLEFIQHISTYLRVSQGDLHQILEDTKQRKPLLEYSLAGLFNANDFIKAIGIKMNGVKTSTTLIEQILRYDRRMILISCGKHTLGLFKHGEQISLYDSNHEAGMQTFTASQPLPLIQAIFHAYKSPGNLHAPFGFRIFTFEDSPGVYPKQTRLLEAIGGPDSSPCALSSRIHSALHIAARIGSKDSMHYYLSRNAKIDNFSRARRTPLYIAASKGHKPEAMLLLSLGADMNKVCRHNKTPLMRAAEKGHLDILKYMLENNKDSTFEDVMTALNNLANMQLKQELVKMLSPARLTQLFSNTPGISEKLLKYSATSQVYTAENRLLFFSKPGEKHSPGQPNPAVRKKTL